ncbi:peptide chain release factor 3 [Candidatus Solirubrobacter pratensis]|uniref:peptide chain release factor 3 n=1 Tax=Candidatus Solirubrobacter pratensis TaxID=1298857 RepID=UPI0004043AC4|nr:peptide chain release factor 3 [Candidatus Solirubrobacter pratensis]
MSATTTAHAAAAASDAGKVAAEAARRRTFAIISHPDAGKTTLTEKLLLYAGAVGEAGAVKGRRGRRAATSDWMELERRRGISVSSTVLRFEHDGVVFNLLDTPGHRDFSEDTLRVLAAVDSAVILLDAARGVEPQTERLFQVARARGIPLMAFVNKYDRPGMEPLAMIDHLESTLGLSLAPLTWPVGIPGDFRGVIDRRDGTFHRFTRSTGGAQVAGEQILAARDAAGEDAALWAVAEEELELVDAVGGGFDAAGFASGERVPLFFGSAAWNFGVGLLLGALAELAPPARARPTADGEPRGVEEPFAAQVFKVQANMDPRHRDRVAFLRVCSGRFERGMRATNARTGRGLALSHAHEVFGQEREVLDDAYPGDVVGVVIGGDVRVGDTLYAGRPVGFPPIPSITPEHFATISNRDSSRHKQFRRGLTQLDQEGVVHVLHREHAQDPVPVLGGVGPMQFEVAVERLRTEFGADVRTEVLPWQAARVTDAGGAATVLADTVRSDVLVRSDGMQLAVFPNRFVLERFADRHPGVRLDRIMRDPVARA